MQEIELHRLEDWKIVVSKILPLKHSVLLLKGNLGAGKTTFTQFLLKELGLKDEVNSPTYAIVNEYQHPKGSIFHFDLYRLKSAQEVLQMGIEEYLDNAYLSIIEWPEVFEEELKNWDYHELLIENFETKRRVVFE